MGSLARSRAANESEIAAAAQEAGSPLSHYNSLGELAVVPLLADAGLAYILAGENLARSSSQDATVVALLNDAAD